VVKKRGSLVKIPYVVTKKSGIYWQPRPISKNGNGKPVYIQGFEPRRLYGDKTRSPLEQGLALYEDMQRHLRDAVDVQQNNTKRWPKGSIGEAFDRYTKTSEWRRKSQGTRDEWEKRVWYRISPLIGDLAPSSITLEAIGDIRDAIEETVSMREAHRVIKVWRALWNVMAAMGYCQRDADPSKALINRNAPARQERWSGREIIRIGCSAWRAGDKGLAAIMAVMWSGMMSPVDARLLTPACRLKNQQGKLLSAFHFNRAKTGEQTIAPLTRRSEAVLMAYMGTMNVIALDDPLFRTAKGGVPFTKNILGKTFKKYRDALYPNDTRTLADIRRSGATEASVGDVEGYKLGMAMGNGIANTKSLRKTYMVGTEAVVNPVNEARRIGRKRINENK